MIQDIQQTTMAYCVMQVAALPTGCKTKLCHYRQRQRPPSLLLYMWLTDADICPLAHPPLPENCRVRLPWRWLVIAGMCPGRGQMLSTGADDRAYSHACHLILMRCTSSLWAQYSRSVNDSKCTPCSNKKTISLIFGHNICECRPIFKIPSRTDSQELHMAETPTYLTNCFYWNTVYIQYQHTNTI